MVTPNPAWVNRALDENWVAIEQRVGSRLMPRMEAGKPVEYGTGSYGTVMPTGTPDIVCKVTSDAAEGMFVAAALSLKEIPAGMIRYKHVFALPGRYYSRPIFVIWRQEARAVGNVIQPPSYVSGRDAEMAEAYRLLLNTKDAGHLARKMVLAKPELLVRASDYESEAYEYVAEHLGWLEGEHGGVARNIHRWLKGSKRLAVLLRFFESGCEMMEHNNPITTTIGNALGYYFERKILLADVHFGNVGQFDHEDYGDEGLIGITDPGHAVFLDNRYDMVTIPTL